LAWKSGLKVPLLLLGLSCTLKTILLGDLTGCGSLLQMSGAFLKFETFQTVQVQKSSPKGHYYLQRAAIPDWMGSTAL
jgi:hypothetical protein